MVSKEFSPKFGAIIGVLALVLLVSVPTGPALEIHHLFGEADHEGHHHSDFDLCQWVQSHTASSLVGEEPTLGIGTYSVGILTIVFSLLISSPLPFLCSSRGPPSGAVI